MSQKVRAKELDVKRGPFIWFSCFLPKLWSYVPSIAKNRAFFKTCADLRKKPSSVYIAL